MSDVATNLVGRQVMTKDRTIGEVVCVWIQSGWPMFLVDIDGRLKTFAHDSLTVVE